MAAMRTDGNGVKQRTAIIIGAGPAGLTAALELLERSDIKVIVLQRDDCLGGLSRTVQYHGNRLDIGGHRFFSKSDRVMSWWLRILPMEAATTATTIRYQQQAREIHPSARGVASSLDQVMLVRQRKSRIYFNRQFFDYPISLSKATIQKLGLLRTFKILVSYARAILFPIRNEKSLEHFFINRFGRELYQTFFKDYTEKIWGIACNQISAEWGKQRIKGLSVFKLLTHFVHRLRWKKASDVSQKQLETSLVEQFLYPKFGPGQMWEAVGRMIREKKGEIVMNQTVDEIRCDGDRILSVTAVDRLTGLRSEYSGDYFFSTMAIKDLLVACIPKPPSNVCEVGQGLVYRDFITVGMLLSRLAVSPDHAQSEKLLKDNWIYIQEPDVKIGRLQIFNNWSPSMVEDSSKVWIGLEYFCFETDELWRLSDEQMIALGAEELEKIGIIDRSDVLDATVVREPKTYPAYFGTYSRFDEVRRWLDDLKNLFPIGRNGMHRYNNQDHSMLTAMTAVDNILAGISDKSNLWEVNTEQEYHESKNTPLRNRSE